MNVQLFIQYINIIDNWLISDYKVFVKVNLFYLFVLNKYSLGDKSLIIARHKSSQAGSVVSFEQLKYH